MKRNVNLFLSHFNITESNAMNKLIDRYKNSIESFSITTTNILEFFEEMTNNFLKLLFSKQ